MERYSFPLDLPVAEMHMKAVGQVSSNPESHHFYAPMPISSMPSNNNAGHNESSGGSVGLIPTCVADQLGSENTPPPVKRKAEVGPLTDSSISQQSALPNKRPSRMGAKVNSAGFLHPSAPQKKAPPAQSKLSSAGQPAHLSQNKKMSRNDSMSGKPVSQRAQAAKRQTTQIESASKVRPESLEAVRSKMRENLESALALADRKQNVSNTDNNQNEATITYQVDSRASEPNSTMGGHAPVSGSEASKDDHIFSAELPTNGSSGNDGQTFQGFHYTSILPEDDVSFGDNFFAKDDLLQGNGLSWAFDFDAQIGEAKEAHPAKKPNPENKEETQVRGKEEAVLTPEKLALKIEAELFKLFGDVNKKYKEKGRSLLFNLKDRNNPDLRESVMSGKITPERLCSMSAEELASKELSEWRTAKAEEFAQMVVLPDTEVDVRRLVKKTHKGEYQVEVDHDDVIAAEISSGTLLVTRPQPKKETVLPHSPPKASFEDKDKVEGQGGGSEDQDFSGSLIIPTDGTDLMQGMIVDELKDAEFLPPIVSLDEFMESLNNEPPFENLSGDAGQKTPTPHVDSPKPGRNNRASDSPKGASFKKAGVLKKHDATAKPSASVAEQKDLPSIVPKVEYIWDGILQLNLSSSVIVGGVFQSGEKTSTKEWPTSLEIKGRVRLDAFEKFLQELPMSRTRAVMVLQLLLKDTSSESQRANLSEAIDSYINDERLGYAEPTPGVELYLCPPIARISENLNKLIPKENSEKTNDKTLENALIAVVIWRRAHISNTIISPNSSSHHKHVPKKQPFTPPLPTRVQDSLNVNVNTPTRAPPPPPPPPPFLDNRVEPEKEEDDDIPPGFGPGAARSKDDDDLPEFNFSGDLNVNNPNMLRSSMQNMDMTQRPVDQVRELIKKYGQSGNGVTNMGRVDNMNIGIEPWKDDDDDDIPEWRPQGPPYALAARGHRPPMHSVTSEQHMVGQMPPGGYGRRGRGGRWVQPRGGQLRGPRWRQ